MTASSHILYFRQGNAVYPSGSTSGYCYIHGQYYGSWGCPACSTAVAPPQSTVTISPVLTEDAIAAMVKAFNEIINGLREQVAERDRQLEELQGEMDELQRKYDILNREVANFTNRA